MSASVCGEVCYACGDIAIKKDRRLLLPGSLAADAWSQIVDKVQQQRPQYQVDVSRLSSLNTVCRKCYGALERFRKLQVQLVTSAEKSLSQLSVISIQPAPITGQKHPRASDHNDAEDVPARKQSRLTDPSPSSRKQLIFAPPLAQSSPAVAVSHTRFNCRSDACYCDKLIACLFVFLCTGHCWLQKAKNTCADTFQEEAWQACRKR